MLEVKELFKFIDDKVILNNINFKLDKGDILGLIGPTGSGKTVLLEILSTLSECSQGNIYLNNKKINKEDVGFMPSTIKLYKKSKIKNLIEYNDTFYKNDTIKKALDLAKTLNLDINVKVEDLSYPDLKKLGFILTISHSPKIIALDEPFKGLEYKDKIKLMDLMRKEGKDGNIVIIASSSLKDPREIARKIALIKKGVIIDIGYTHKLNIKKYYNIRIKAKNIKKVNFDLTKLKVKKLENDYIECILFDKINNFINQISSLEIDYLYIEEPDILELINYFYNRKE